jgi:peptide/nickel transport system permease protein
VGAAEVPLVTYLARRVFSLVLVLIGVSMMAFVLGDLAPGDPAVMHYLKIYGYPPQTQEEVEKVREVMGLDDPMPIRYVRWALGVVQGDLGKSFASGAPVLPDLLLHLPVTLKLAFIGLVVGSLIAFPLGILAAVFHNSLIDLVARFFSLLGSCIPSFWLAYMLILAFSVKLRWLPVAGSSTWQHFVLPTLALGTSGAASLSRLVRSSVLDVMRSDYIRAARAKGVGRVRVILVHTLRNALIPVVTHMGTLFGYLAAGSVILETVFAIAGLGRLIIDAIAFRDFPVIQGFVLFTGTVFVTVNLLVDLSYTLIDPRVRLVGEGA